MAITFVGQASAQGSSVALPAHVAGDLLVIFAYSESTAVAPSQPAGWTQINFGSGNSNGHRVAYKIATSSAEVSGTWTTATQIAVSVYRGAHQTAPIGGVGSTTNVADIIIPAATLEASDGSSWVYMAFGRRAGNSGQVGSPSGLTLRSKTEVRSAGQIMSYDTASGVTSWAQRSFGGTSAVRYRSVSVEIKAAPSALPTITGQLVRTLGALTAAGASRIDISGSGSGNLGSLVLAATGALLNRGALSATLGDLIVSASSMLPGTGRAAVTLDDLSATGRIESGNTGRLSVVLEALTSISSAETSQGENSGGLGSILGELTLSAASALLNTGSLSATLDSVAAVATGRLRTEMETPRKRIIVVRSHSRIHRVQPQERRVLANG